MSSECVADVLCPECGSAASRRVRWTIWGGFFGPFFFQLVRCLGCGTRYTGRTGQAEKQAAHRYLRVLAPVVLLSASAVLAFLSLMLVVQR
jgi:hypothetical protein